MKLEKTQNAQGIILFIDLNYNDFNGRDWATSWNAIRSITNEKELVNIRTNPMFAKFVKNTADMINDTDKTRFFKAIDIAMLLVAAAKIGRMNATDELFAAVSKTE